MTNVGFPGQVITFYSYKGGTGRSMLLANIAWLLADNGKRVLVIDWDLEAPGLHRYFRPFIVDPDLTETDGLIDLIWAFASKLLASKESGTGSGQDDADIDLDSYIYPLDWNFPGPGGIDFISAGRQGGTYSERVNTFDWKHFYQLGGQAVLKRLREQWRRDYDYVLIDSRTGVSDTSGICTIEMPDAIVACLTLNRQSIEGVSSILRSIREWEATNISRDSSAQNRMAITFFPIATRVDNSEKEKLDVARIWARDAFAPILEHKRPQDIREYWDAMEVTYRPYYAYEEVLAVFGDTSGVNASARNLNSEIVFIGERITGRRLTGPEVPEHARRKILGDYALGKNMPDGRHKADPALGDQRFIERNEILDEVYAKEGQWRTQGHPYRLLLSHHQLDLILSHDAAQFGVRMSAYIRESRKFLDLKRLIHVFFFLSYLVPIFFMVLELLGLYGIGPAGPFDILSFVTSFVFAPLSAGVISITMHFSGELPYGMRAVDVFRLVLLDPFISDVDHTGSTKLR